MFLSAGSRFAAVLIFGVLIAMLMTGVISLLKLSSQ